MEASCPSLPCQLACNQALGVNNATVQALVLFISCVSHPSAGLIFVVLWRPLISIMQPARFCRPISCRTCYPQPIRAGNFSVRMEHSRVGAEPLNIFRPSNSIWIERRPVLYFSSASAFLRHEYVITLKESELPALSLVVRRNRSSKDSTGPNSRL